MVIEEIMKKNVITLSPTDSLGRAKLLMYENGIRHLPVVDMNQLVIGLVTRSDIYNHFLASGDENRTVIQDVMNKNVITGHPLDFVEEASAIFYEHKIGCLPIVDGERLVGIITETDMLHTFVQLTGAHQPGSQIEIRVPNIAGMLSEVASVIKERSVNILSVLVYPSKDESHKTLVFRVQTMNPLPLIHDLKTKKYDVLWPRVPGAINEE
ncbi:acetoin utilization AcuB family protein [Bacillus sp. DJP31]|uniref:acetoin utilization AcuB family protein n=1 Tax=Bacillus sp. DJP31 TaxID=3409789 RepID=UPI003BB74931